MHVLTTFLGGGANRQYRPARYAFSPREVYETSLFGWALLQHLRASGTAADKLVVFGTPTSFWEHLLRALCPERTDDIAALAAQAQAGVTRRDLQPYQDLVLNALRPYGVQSVLLEPVDFLQTPDHQARFIGHLADLLQPDDRLSLDITHGMRHQPVLCMLAAMVLRAAKHVAVEGIYYGALELTPRQELAETPVLRLDPLLAFADWIAALSQAEATGDYGAVAELFRKDGVKSDLCNALAEGFFLNAIGNFPAAAKQFDAWRTGIGQTALSGACSLFVEEIGRRANQVTRGDRWRQLAAAAEDALDRGMLVRAAELAYEAACFAHRQAAHSDYYGAFDRWMEGRHWQNVKMTPQARWKQAFDRLRVMRNRMAHLDFQQGGQSQAEQALASRPAATAALKETFAVLFSLDRDRALDLG